MEMETGEKKMKYVLVTGGDVSGLGEGVTANSIGVLLKACGLRVTAIKIDPYLNTDAGTMSPFEHGEVFVLDDGGEVDLDLGTYGRFLDVKLNRVRDNNITTGKIYQHVINKDRKGDYLGKTVQVVPPITDAIQEWIERVAMVPVDGLAGPADVCVIEMGGTIGDIESMPFIEALRRFSYPVGHDNFCLIHVSSLVPILSAVGEQPQKTKPTQHSVRGLRSLGLTPDILACCSTTALDDNVKKKISQFFHVSVENIITLYDVPNIWHIPLLLRDQKAHEAILKALNLKGVAKEPALVEWSQRAELCDKMHEPVRIAMVGKYTGLTYSDLHIFKPLLHASVACGRKLSVDWVPACDFEDATANKNPEAYKAAWMILKGADGVLVHGGFGDRGVEGKILATKYAQENCVPFLDICLGMQQPDVIEYARSVMGLKDANSTEFDPYTQTPRAIFTPEGSTTQMGGTNDCKSAKLPEDGGITNQQEKKDSNGPNGAIALVVAILGIFYRGIDPSIFETKHNVVVAILVVVLIYVVTSTVLSKLETKSTMFTIVSDIELFSQLLFVPLFIFMLVPRLGLISLVLWTFSLSTWIATRYFPEYFSGRLVWPPVLWGEAAASGRSLLGANSEGELPR